MRIPVVITWKTVAGLLALAVGGALAVGFSGLVSVAASSGHYSPVSWFLHWTLENAVRTQSALISVPADVDLDDPVLVQRAAGHFATGCAPCHGAPGVNQTADFLQMMPPPPRLEGKVGQWADRELFWIGLHGIKYSGMPAWADQNRPDEVWAMVAFLRALPGLTPDAYRTLALSGIEETPPPVGTASSALPRKVEIALADCARCHGRDGRGVGTSAAAGAFPVISGQPEAYLRETLLAYAGGRRESGIMEPAASRYDAETLEALAAHYAGQPGPASPAPTSGMAAAGTAPGLPETPTASAAPGTGTFPRGVDPAAALASREAIAATLDPQAPHGAPYERDDLLALGREVATRGLAPQKVPACESCHGPGAEAKNPLYPSLAGQPAWYLATHLTLWKEGHRGGTPASHIMNDIALHMSDEQIEAVALWYSQNARTAP